MQEEYKLYYREANGKLGVSAVSGVESHVEAINFYKDATKYKGVVLTIINKGTNE